MNDNIYKLYIQQKEEIADIVAKTGQLLPAFQKAIVMLKTLIIKIKGIIEKIDLSTA